MNSRSKVETFVSEIRRRLNQFRFRDAIIWAILSISVLLCLAGGIYIIQGYEVPGWIYWAGLGGFGLVVPAIWLLRRWNVDSTAHFVDQFYELKDTVVSALHFQKEGRKGEFYDLQAQAAEARVSGLDARRVRYHWPRRLLTAAVLLVGLSVLMGFKQPSPEVLERLRIEAETDSKTEEINEFLEETLEELAEELEKEGIEEVDAEDFKKMLEGLEKTSDRQAAMRQYADLERKLREATQRLERRKDEQLMARIGEDLQEARETQELGKKLENKDFQKAAEELEAMAPEKPDAKKLSEQRKELARLKAAAQQMAASANAANRRGSANANGQSGQSGQSGPSGQSGSEGMEGMISQLNESVQQLDKSLQAAMRQQQMGQLNPDMMSQCQSCQSQVNQQLQQLSQSLCKLGAQCKARNMMLSMCQKMGQCQGYLCQSQFPSLGQCLSQGPKQGGLMAGVGSVESRRNPLLEELSGGEISNLQGTKGQGPSQSTVESTEDGDGVSTRRAVAQRREYAKQMESFVQREDVPPAVKEGVKRYFEGIHLPEETSQETTSE